MRNKFTFLLLLLLMCGVKLQAQNYSRCMASPDAVTLLQPDGTFITVVGAGNIDINYTQTVDGYTLLKNKYGIYEYALQSNDGGLETSGIKANNNDFRTLQEKQFLSKQAPYITYSAEKTAQILNKKLARYKQDLPQDEHENEKPITASFPALGKRKVLLLLIQYPDLKAQYTRSDFDNMMNKSNYKNIGSYKDFYAKNSFGKLDLETDVFGWYMADYSYSYYANNGPQGMAATRQLIANALDAAKNEGVDFSKYDNDKDGQADGILVVHAGPGAEEGSQNKYIWSHRWNLGESQRNFDNTLIDNYAIQPETRGGTQTRMVGIGVFCHEFGHLLGLPDLYDINYKSEGIGNWSVMAGGNWLNSENTPANFCAFTRTYLKWMTPLTLEEEGYYTLHPSSLDSTIYRINTPVKHEYFLLENRQLKGFDAKLNGKGMAIWHINDSVISRGMWSNTVNANVKKKGIDLEEADGKDDLDKSGNRGDGGDLFPGTAKKTSFTDATAPNAKNYNGKNTGINIFEITNLPDSSVRFGFSATPQAKFEAPVVVCQNTNVAFQNNSIFASKFTWAYNNTIAGTQPAGNFKFQEPGEYYVTLKAISLAGVESQDSVKIQVIPAALAAFSMQAAAYNVTLKNASANSVSNTIYWGDGNYETVTSENISHTYKDTGIFIVKMICVSAEGCGDTSITKLRMPAVQVGDPIDLQANPNPFHDKLTLQFVVDVPGAVSIKMYNMLGQEVFSERAKYDAGAQIKTIEMPQHGFSNGTYIVKMMVNNKPAQIKLVKW
ncbi:MAG: M6 family metalloprotease domain-containing protein [Sphingobacteriales bacterium]|nr:MAG: M6 family metalloprotease domain-containing protein [Sphingobacteriales bacterium]